MNLNLKEILMINKLLLAAAAVATLATGAIAGSSAADAGVKVVIGSPGHGYGLGFYGWRGHRGAIAWRGVGRHNHGYRSYRPNCRWKVKKVKVRYWGPHNNRWNTRTVHRRYRVCY